MFWGYFEEFNRILERKNVRCKIIFDERAKKNTSSCRDHGYQVKTLAKEFMSPAEVNIYKDTVAIVLWTKTPLAIVIREKEIAKSFRRYFNLLWNMAS
ncbi:MAG: hypothetical protein ABH879_00460 [archaeon]